MPQQQLLHTDQQQHGQPTPPPHTDLLSAALDEAGLDDFMVSLDFLLTLRLPHAALSVSGRQQQQQR